MEYKVDLKGENEPMKMDCPLCSANWNEADAGYI